MHHCSQATAVTLLPTFQLVFCLQPISMFNTIRSLSISLSLAYLIITSTSAIPVEVSDATPRGFGLIERAISTGAIRARAIPIPLRCDGPRSITGPQGLPVQQTKDTLSSYCMRNISPQAYKCDYRILEAEMMARGSTGTDQLSCANTEVCYDGPARERGQTTAGPLAYCISHDTLIKFASIARRQEKIAALDGAEGIPVPISGDYWNSPLDSIFTGGDDITVLTTMEYIHIEAQKPHFNGGGGRPSGWDTLNDTRCENCENLRLDAVPDETTRLLIHAKPPGWRVRGAGMNIASLPGL